jgi:DNA-binding response OmpR family regulator
MKPTILIVDDDTSVRDSLKKLLEAEKYRVLSARDSAEAFEWFESERVDLVVMDVNLGEDDGWETFGRMAAANNSVPTIIVTAEFGQRDRAIATGVEALIEKPMDAPLFLEIVEELLANHREGQLERAIGDERYCRYVNRSNEAFRRDLELRCSTPLNMSWFDRLQLVAVAETTE